ncbi:MAG: aldo/keto reductase [Clostridia bacterium]
MEYRKIKNLDKKVSRIIFGSSGAFKLPEEQSFKLLDDMFSLGINTFDTAAVYGNDGETKLIKWIAERDIHDKVVLITKGAHHNAWRKRLTPFDIMSDVTDSLSKKGADYIDIYLLHRDDPSVPVAPIIDTLNRLYDSGKIRTFGASNWTSERIEMANEYAYKFNLMPFSSISPHYGLAEQVKDPWSGGVTISGESNIKSREYYKANQMPIFCYSSLGKGFCSGKFKSHEKDKATEILSNETKRGYMYDCNFERLKRAEILSEKLNINIPQISLAWLTSQELNTFPIIYTSKKSSMIENISALDIKLNQKEIEYLDLLREEI